MPNRTPIEHCTISKIIKNIAIKSGRRDIPDQKQNNILFFRWLDKSARIVTTETEISLATVRRYLKKENWHPNKLHLAQKPKKIEIVRWSSMKQCWLYLTLVILYSNTFFWWGHFLFTRYGQLTELQLLYVIFLMKL